MQTEDFIKQLRIIMDDEEGHLDDVLVKIANYVRGTRKIAEELNTEAEGYYNQWCFCKDHNFELDALHQRGKYDLTYSHLREIKHQFNIVLD